MKTRNRFRALMAAAVLLAGLSSAQAQPNRVLIHMKTALSVDDAQICAVPNVAWAFLKAGDRVTILIDASAVTAVARGFGWSNKLRGRSNTAMDRANLPARERRSLSEQMGVPLDQVPRNYGEYLDFLKGKGVEIYGNKTMMLLYNIDSSKVASAVTPVPLARMTEIFTTADRIVVY